jgi:hypothetical protein
MKYKILVWAWLLIAMCYTAFFTLEYKNSLAISDPEQKMQRIEDSTDLLQLKRTAKMEIDFMYSVHASSLRLWRISLAYGILNITFFAYCAFCINKGSNDKGF